jgi:protein TonB
MSALSLGTGEVGRDSARWGLSFIVICALHLGVAAWFWHAHIFVPAAPDVPPDTVLIDLEPVPAPPVAAPAPPPPQPPPPEPEVKKIEEPPLPPPPKEAVALPKPPPPKPAPPRPKRVVEEPPPPQPMPQQAEAKPLPAPMPKARAAPAPSMDVMANWEHKLLARLQSFLRYPRRAQLRQQDGIAYVKVVIDRRGNLVSSALERSSGIPVLDEEAVAVAERAKPFPPPPEALGENVVRVVPVRFILR